MLKLVGNSDEKDTNISNISKYIKMLLYKTLVNYKGKIATV